MDAVFEDVPLGSTVGFNQEPFVDLPSLIENAMAAPLLGAMEVIVPIAAAVQAGKADAAIRQIIELAGAGDVDTGVDYIKDLALYST